MIERVRTMLNRQLDEAEQRGRCVVAATKVERQRYRTAKDEGIVVEVDPHVFARATYWGNLKPTQQMRHRLYALHELHPDWVLAGPSAALVYGLSVSNRCLARAYVGTNRRTHHRSNASREFLAVSGDEMAVVGGLPVTSFARTVLDCLRLMDFRSGLAIADSALRSTHRMADELAEEIRQRCCRVPGLRRACALLALADGRSESGGESIARATMLELGLALPDLQRRYEVGPYPDDSFRVDYAWDVPGGTIVGELDGFEKYVDAEMRGERSLAQVIDGEHRRQTLLEALPQVLRFVRFGFADVMRDQLFLNLLMGSGVQRTMALDERVLQAGGILRCR